MRFYFEYTPSKKEIVHPARRALRQAFFLLEDMHRRPRTPPKKMELLATPPYDAISFGPHYSAIAPR